MSSTYAQPGRILDLPAPAGGVVSGKAYKLNAIICIALVTVAAGAPFSGITEEVHDVDAKTAQAWDVGVVVYWDDTNRVFTTTASSNTKAGVTVAAKAADASSGRIKLIPSI